MLFDVIRQEIFDRLRAALGENTASDLVLEVPPDPRLGDFAFPAFRLAKAMRKAPPAIAAALKEKLSAEASITALCEVATAGPYLNFTVRREVLAGQALPSILLSGGELAGKPRSGGRPIVIEYSSPNVAKAFNIYHLRGTMLGNCLSRVLTARGHDVVAINHLGDWGTQYGTLALAYEKWGEDRELETRGIEYLVELYVRINGEMERSEELAAQGREYFARLEKGDPKIRGLWERFVQLSLREFERTYQRLGVRFDHTWGESFYVDRIPELEKRLAAAGLLEESEGALIVRLDKFAMPPCLVRKQDGSTIYATRDLAAAVYRHERFRFQKMAYVVGGEQKLHFAQVFKVLELLGLPWAADCVHVDYGLYRFRDRKMSTRKGNYVTMESVLDLAVERVREIIEEKKSMPPEKIAEAAEIIGTGAVIFNDLATDRNSDVNFDLDRVLDFEGETGPYIQYAHTRCLGILRNAPAPLLPGVDASRLLDLSATQPGFVALSGEAARGLGETEELDLIRMAARLPLVLDQVAETYRPSALATYLIDLTKAFNGFYRTHKVLVDDALTARARLALVLATQRTLLRGLTILGMRAPERM